MFQKFEILSMYVVYIEVVLYYFASSFLYIYTRQAVLMLSRHDSFELTFDVVSK